MVLRFLPLFFVPAVSESRSLRPPAAKGSVTMRVVDAKSGSEASVPDFAGFRDAVVRAVLSHMAAGGTAPFVEGAPYDDWDSERLDAAMSRVLDAAQTELRRWLPPPPSPPPPASASSLGFGFEAEILQRETQKHVYPPSPPSSMGRGNIPAECPAALRILRLGGLWCLMRIPNEDVGFMECGETKEVLFALEQARPLVAEVWKDAAGDLIRVCVSCEGNSFLIWG